MPMGIAIGQARYITVDRPGRCKARKRALKIYMSVNDDMGIVTGPTSCNTQGKPWF